MAGKLNNESKVGLGLALSAPPHEGGVDMVLHAPRCHRASPRSGLDEDRRMSSTAFSHL